jgi:D-amino-acid dehydrogenase
MDVPRGGPRFYRTPIAADGWLYKPDLEVSADDAKWMREAERVPLWLLREFNQEIISFNRESEPLWKYLSVNYPELFDNAGFNKRLLRVYASRERYERALVTERAIGAIREVLSPRELGARFPSLREAVDSDYVQGALEVTGFSVNIHQLCRNVVTWLEQHGVEFRWNTRVSQVIYDADGTVSGVASSSGTLEADHFVACLGAFPGELEAGLDSAGQIKPMLGMWLTLPDTSPELDLPIKVTRSGFAAAGSAEGANVIAGVDQAGRKVIHISSGHGFIGTDKHELDTVALAELGRAVEETAQGLFPSKYAEALESKRLTEVQRFCIRPWTASGLGLFEVKPARKGLFILTGGHNTGGFAQSPSVARAVESALTGRHHAMHVLYHPRRLINFTGVHLGAT